MDNFDIPEESASPIQVKSVKVNSGHKLLKGRPVPKLQIVEDFSSAFDELCPSTQNYTCMKMNSSKLISSPVKSVTTASSKFIDMKKKTKRKWSENIELINRQSSTDILANLHSAQMAVSNKNYDQFELDSDSDSEIVDDE